MKSPTVKQDLAQIKKLIQEEENIVRRLENLEVFWTTRQNRLVEELNKLSKIRLQSEADLEVFKHFQPERTPPGPKSLWWVDTPVFAYICSVVILANLVTAVMELMHPNLVFTFWIFEQLYLSFYALELVLKATFFQTSFVTGRMSRVWWNWLDTLIVLCGCIDQWLLPLLDLCIRGTDKTEFYHPGTLGGLRLFKVVRAVSFLRVLKLIKIFLHTDLSWTEEPLFQSFITGVVMFNAIILGWEVDHPWGIFFWIEHAILAIYFFELVVRLKSSSWTFFVHSPDWVWNDLDFIIVFFGVLEQWLWPLVEHLVVFSDGETIRKSGKLFPLLRMVRLLRVLRIVRQLKSLRPLYNLAVGLLEAMQSVQWVLVMTVIGLYAAGIVYRNVMGVAPSGAESGGIAGAGTTDSGESWCARMLFSSVPQTMFHLFRLMNGLSPDPCIIGSAFHKAIFVVFILLSDWALLAILSAVVSDRMISCTMQSQKSLDEVHNEDCKTQSRDRLNAIFDQVCVDKTGCVDECSFYSLINKRKELCEVSNLTAEDLRDLFNSTCYKDIDGQSKINSNEFVDKLQTEGKEMTERTIFRLERYMKHLDRHFDRKLTAIYHDVLTWVALLQILCVSADARSVAGVQDGPVFEQGATEPGRTGQACASQRLRRIRSF